MQQFEELPADAQIDPIPDGFEALPDDAQLEPVHPSEGGGEVQFNDDPAAVATKLSPEDEAHRLQLNDSGSADQIAAFLHSKGFTTDAAALQKYVTDRDAAKAQRRPYGVDGGYARPQAPDQGAAAAFENGISQGASLGFSDEIHGALSGLGALAQGGSYTDTYNRTVDQDRAQLGADEENHGIASFAGNLAGGLVLPVGLEKAGVTASTRAVGVAARDAAIAEGLSASAADRIAARAVAHRLAAEGAAYGGAYGAGSSEGDPSERLLNAGVGAVGGAVAGGLVLPALAKAATYGRKGVNAALSAGRDIVGGFTREGAQDRAGKILTQGALRPIDDVLADIDSRAPSASGAQPTLAEVANDPGIAGLQRGFANTDTTAGAQIGERYASNALARTRYASESMGDTTPQALQDYASGQLGAAESETAQQQAARLASANMRIAGEQQAAQQARTGAEGGLSSAREAIGPAVDRTATGSVARDAFSTAYDAAKQRSREAYANPILKQAQPIEIPREVFQRVRDAADDFYGDGGGEIPSQLQSILSDMADPHATTRTLTNIDRRLADFAGEAGMAGRNSEAAFAKRIRGNLSDFVERAAPQEYRDALSSAKAVRAEQGRIFETGDAPKAFARDRYNNPVVGDTTVPGRIVRPGVPGGDTADGLIAAVGHDTAETLVRQELRRAIEEGGVQSESQARNLATRFGEVARRFPGVQSDLQAVQTHAARLDAARGAEAVAQRTTYTPAETAAIKERAAVHDTILASPLGKAADAATDPSSFVGSLLKRSDDGRQLRYLARQVSGNADATNGLRRALGDYIETSGAGPNFTAAGTQIPSINNTRKAIDTVIKRAGDAITPQQKMALKSVAKELRAANFSVTASKPAGSETAMNQSLARMIGEIPIGGHAKSVAIKIINSLGNEKEVKRILTHALLDPDFAATLLKRPTKQHMLDISERIAGRKGILPVSNAISAGAMRMTGTNQ